MPHITNSKGMLCRMLLILLLAQGWSGMAVADATPESSAATAVAVDDSTFRCIRDMSPVRQFYIDNLVGDIAGTLGGI